MLKRPAPTTNVPGSGAPLRIRPRQLLAAAAASGLFPGMDAGQAPAYGGPSATAPAGVSANTPASADPKTAPGGVGGLLVPTLEVPEVGPAPTPPGAPDYSGLRVDTSSRTRPVADPHRSRLVAGMRLGGAAAQLAGALLGGGAGEGIAAAGQGVAQGGGRVAEMDRQALRLEQEAYDRWLREAQATNLQVGLREVDAGADAARERYRGEREDYTYRRGRRDAAVATNDERLYDATLDQRDRERDVADDELDRKRELADDVRDRQREVEDDLRDFQQDLQRDREKRAADRADAEQAFQRSLVLIRERARTGREATTEDRAGAQAVITDIDSAIGAETRRLSSLRRLLADAPNELVRRRVQDQIDDVEEEITGLRDDRRTRLAALRDVSNVGIDPGQPTDDTSEGRLAGADDDVARIASRVRASRNPSAALRAAVTSLRGNRRISSETRTYMIDQLLLQFED